MSRRCLSSLLPAVASVTLLPAGLAAAQAVPAFPGADGAAAHVTGGRGGLVYHVTALDKNFSDNRPGTLRYGLTDSNFGNQPRTIVFDVAGTFWLGRYGAERGHDNGWDTQSRLNIGSHVTIAGQTAPGPVNIMGGVVKMGGTNTVLRNVTIAPGYGMRTFRDPETGFGPTPGDFPDSYVYDAIDISGQGIMIDHVSTMYGTDEHISANEATKNLTVQYSHMSQGQNYPQADPGFTGHAMGSLLEAGNSTSPAAVSFHHNLYAHQKSRVPQMQNGGVGGYYDFRNNVFYNWFGTAGTKTGTTFLNLVNNFYLAGDGGDQPVGGSDPGITTQGGGTGVIAATSSIYRNGNVLDSNKDADANDAVAVTNGGSPTPIWMGGTATYNGVTDTPQLAFDRVLNYVGANWWTRDGVFDTPDERIINEVRTGTGKIMAWADDPFNDDPNEGVEWRSMLSYRAHPITGAAPFNRAANWDTDQDGMPNAWEVAHGLNANAADDNGDFDADGYSNLEEYLNEIAAWPAPAPLVFNNANGTGRFEEINNWQIRWQPSRFDEARIHNGSVTINSVGQHARVLKVAPSAGDAAVVTLSAGWIDVAERLEVANSGQFIITGGALLTPAVQLSGSGLLELSPGGDKHLRLQSLGITESAKLDLGDNKLIMIGGDAGTWNGEGYTGISGMVAGEQVVTTMRDATVGLTGLAVARAGQVGKTNFGGQEVGPDDVLVMYTYAGDANLDGVINIDDYGRIDANVSQSGSVFGWYNGDFNYDGKINIDDYGIIDGNISRQGAAFPSSMTAVRAVPEPAGAAALALVALVVRRRRAVS